MLTDTADGRMLRLHAQTRLTLDGLTARRPDRLGTLKYHLTSCSSDAQVTDDDPHDRARPAIAEPARRVRSGHGGARCQLPPPIAVRLHGELSLMAVGPPPSSRRGTLSASSRAQAGATSSAPMRCCTTSCMRRTSTPIFQRGLARSRARSTCRSRVVAMRYGPARRMTRTVRTMG